MKMTKHFLTILILLCALMDSALSIRSILKKNSLMVQLPGWSSSKFMIKKIKVREEKNIDSANEKFWGLREKGIFKGIEYKREGRYIQREIIKNYDVFYNTFTPNK
jgi:hypothetical protein